MTAEQQSPGETPQPWGLIGWVVVIAAFVIGFLTFPLRAVGTRGEYLPGDEIDNRLNNVVLEHGYLRLTGRVDSFWDIPNFYPHRRVTAWSDAHLGMLPIYSGLRAFGLSPEGAFQGYFLIPFVLNFGACVWAIRRLGFGAFGAAAGAYLFTFGLPLVAQLPHVQLYPRFLVPPAVVFGWEYLRAPRTSRLVSVGACLVGQTYLSVYIGYLLVLLFVAGLLVVVLRFGRQLPWGELFRPEPQARTRRVLVFAGAVLTVLPLALGHASGSGVPDRGQVRILAPRPGAWFTPPTLIATFPELSELTGLRPGVPGEQQQFTGFVTLAAVAVGLVTIIRPGPFGGRWSAVAVSAWSAVLLAVLVTRWEGIWLYAPITYIPGIGGIRAMGRITLVLLFPCAIALAGCADALISLASRASRLLAVLTGVLVVGLVVADQWLVSAEGSRGAEWKLLRYPKELVLARQAPVAGAIRRHPAPTLVYVFPSVAGNSRHGPLLAQLEAMRAAQDHGLPCVNGWSGYLAPDWDYFPSYRDLMKWLTEKHRVAPEVLAGLVVVGEPVPDPDPEYESAMRKRFPPQPAPVEP